MKLPYFRWHPKDFDTDQNVRLMSMCEVGLYVMCLNHCWINGSIPNDVRKIAKIVGQPLAQVKKSWPAVAKCFKENSQSELVNPKQEKERKWATERHERAKDANGMRNNQHVGSVGEGLEKDEAPRAYGSVSDSDSFSVEGGLGGDPDRTKKIPWRKKTRKERGLRNHVDCPCWATGEYRWVSGCPHHPASNPHTLPIAAVPAVPTTPTIEAPQPTAAPLRSYSAEWNAAVPEAPVEPDDIPLVAFAQCSGDPKFSSSFGELCQIAHRIHVARGAEVGWLTFPWILKQKNGEPPGWKKLKGMAWMASAKDPPKKETISQRSVRLLTEERARQGL